jgi:hypothetical protein
MYHDDAGCKQASCGCIKTAKDLRGQSRTPPFRSINNRSVWLVRFVIATIIATIISLVIVSYLTLSDSFDPQPDSILNFISTLTSIIPILGFIVGLFWYYRASKNIHSFGAKQVWRPILSIIWWLIPPLNLYLPYDVTQQFWKVSNPKTKIVVGTEWKDIPSSNMIKIWWLLFLSPLFAGLVLGLVYGIGLGLTNNEAEEDVFMKSTEPVLYFGMVSIALGIVSIFSYILFIKIVKQISIWQELKSGTST